MILTFEARSGVHIWLWPDPPGDLTFWPTKSKFAHRINYCFCSGTPYLKAFLIDSQKQVGIISPPPPVRVLTRAGPRAFGHPSPQGFRRYLKKRRCSAPPFLSHLLIPLFSTCGIIFRPRSPGHVKWFHLRKSLNARHSYIHRLTDRLETFNDWYP